MPRTAAEAPTREINCLREALTARSIELLRAEDFDRAQALTQIAREVKELEARIHDILGDEGHRAASMSATASRHAGPSRDFPRFYRQGEVIVKRALRRDRKATYEQRCPRPEFEEVLGAVQAEARTRDDFEAPQIKERVKCPDYHVYLVVALLEHLDYLESPRRGVYRLRRGGGPGWAEEVWRQVPQDDGRAT